MTSTPPESLTTRQLVSIIIIMGLLIGGVLGGAYLYVKNSSSATCLGCLGLNPFTEMKFTFKTANGADHPDFVLEKLGDKPLFIEYTQPDELCSSCKKMRPKVEDLIKNYDDEIDFIIIDVSNPSSSNYNYRDSFHVYDVENIHGGNFATPTFVIITLGYDDGIVKPYFATGYGLIGENADEGKYMLSDTLDDALRIYDQNKNAWYP